MNSFISRYRAYLADNPSRYWFKRKVYGWGWTPATWEGWGCMAVFLVLIVLNFFRIDALSHSGSDTALPFVFQTIGMALVLIAVAFVTGEEPKWMWGLPKEEGKE